MRVVDTDGHFVGFVKELHAESVIVRRPDAEDLAVPSSAYEMTSQHVRLTVSHDKLDRMHREARLGLGESRYASR